MSSHIMDLKNNSVGGQTIRPIAGATATTGGITTGASIDCIDVVGPLSATLTRGIFTSPGTLDCKLQEAIEDPDSLGSALSSDWSDISGATWTQVATSSGEETILVKNASKRFVRAIATVAGGGASVLIAVTIHGQRKSVNAGTGHSISPAV